MIHEATPDYWESLASGYLVHFILTLELENFVIHPCNLNVNPYQRGHE